jgi:hypothetical protein
MVVFTTTTSAKDDELVEKSSVKSEKTQKTLINDDGTKLEYIFYTNQITWSDNTVVKYLEGEITLVDAITYYAVDPTENS